MKRLQIVLVLIVLLFAMVSPVYAQDSHCISTPNIGTIQTTSTNLEPIYFIAGDEIQFTFLKSLQGATSVTIKINLAPVFDLALGESGIYTIPTDGYYILGFISDNLTPVKVALACVLYDAFGGIVKDGKETTENPTYGSTNWQYGAAHIAILFIEYDNEGVPSIGLYDYAAETYYSDFVTVDMVQALMDAPPLENTLIFTFNNISVYVLTTGEMQFNMTDIEGKEYVFILPSFTGEGAYGYIIEPTP